MRKVFFVNIILLVAICFILSACGVGNSSNLPTNGKNSVYEDNNYIYHKELVNFSEYSSASYKTNIMELPMVNGKMPSVTHVDENLNLYTLAVNSPMSINEPLFCELGMFNINSGEYNTIITLDNGTSTAYFAGVSEKYVVWKERLGGEQRGITQFHLYDKTSHKDQIIYNNHTINPKTGEVSYINDNPVVILNDTIYFDDLTGYNDDALEIDVLSYDIASGKVSTIAKMAERPFKYQDGVAYLKKSENSYDPVLYSYIDGKEEIVNEWSKDYLNENIAYITLADDTIFLSKRNYHKEFEDLIISTSIYIGKSSEPLVEGKTSNYTYGVKSNGRMVVWEVTDLEKPVFYDMIGDRFVRLDNEDEGYYASFLTTEYLLFLAHSERDNENSPLKYILIH